MRPGYAAARERPGRASASTGSMQSKDRAHAHLRCCTTCLAEALAQLLACRARWGLTAGVQAGYMLPGAQRALGVWREESCHVAPL